jgi:hypothetical protein
MKRVHQRPSGHWIWYGSTIINFRLSRLVMDFGICPSDLPPQTRKYLVFEFQVINDIQITLFHELCQIGTNLDRYSDDRLSIPSEREGDRTYYKHLYVSALTDIPQYIPTKYIERSLHRVMYIPPCELRDSLCQVGWSWWAPKESPP